VLYCTASEQDSTASKKKEPSKGTKQASTEQRPVQHSSKQASKQQATRGNRRRPNNKQQQQHDADVADIVVASLIPDKVTVTVAFTVRTDYR
jgi:hypothetical protein